MELLVSFPDRPTIKDPLVISKKIGAGKFCVYEAQSPTRKEKYALKVFPKNTSGITQYEKEKLMFSLTHPNVIQSIPIKCHRKDFVALLTEYASHGDFFELVTSGGLVNEIVVRSYFHQLVEGLEYIHSKGVAHLDLKLENIMLGADYMLKIIDFDQAQKVTDDLITSGGSQGYRAPEVQIGICKDLEAADIFSAGVILYAFQAREFPFLEVEDPTFEDIRCYSTFVKNNDKFWQKKAESRKDRNIFSAEFRQLVNGMLECDPENRFTIEEIKNSEWYKGPVLDNASLKQEAKQAITAIARRKQRASLQQPVTVMKSKSPEKKPTKH